MSKVLMERKNDLITRAEEIVNVAKAETRELTDDEVKELEGIKGDVAKITRTLELDAEVRAMSKMEIKDETPKEDNTVDKIEVRTMKVGNDTVDVDVRELEQFENYIRGTVNERSDVNMTVTDNGAVIPTTIVNWIIRRVYDICPILDRSQKFNVKGKLDIPYYPYDSDVITVAYQSEFSDLESTAGSFATVELSGFLAGCLTKVSRSLINNTKIDIVGFVVDEMAYAIRRFIERELLIGTEDKVDGLSTLSNGITAASETAITADEIVRLHDSIKDEFQRNAIWIMSPATRTALRLLKSTTGYYLLNDDLSTPFGISLLGKPVYVSDNMPDMASGKTVIYYGDMHGLATKFNEDINIEVLRERFATQHAYGIVGWFEFDAKVVDEQQIAKLTMASEIQ